MSNETETTAERLVDLTRLVQYVLWSISTSQPDALDQGVIGPFEEALQNAIQHNAQELFANGDWVANVVAKYAVLAPTAILEMERDKVIPQ